MTSLRLGHPNQQGYMGVDDVTLDPAAVNMTGGLMNNANFLWDTVNLVWIKATSGSGASGHVTVDNFPSTQAVTGAFYQTTQPVSVGNFPSTQAVTGTFYQVTQPVSGAFFQATQPVSGSFYQATQPVSAVSLPLPSGAATDANVTAQNPYRGVISYYSGTLGTVAVPAGARVVSLSAHSVTGGGITIFGGQYIPVPINNGFSDGWSGFVGPAGGGSIVFTGTDSYYVVLNQ